MSDVNSLFVRHPFQPFKSHLDRAFRFELILCWTSRVAACGHILHKRPEIKHICIVTDDFFTQLSSLAFLCFFDLCFAGTAEIRFWWRDTVFCWSASSPLKIQNTGNFELVFNASAVGNKKPQKLRAKTENLILKLHLSFPSSFSCIIYCAKDKLCLHSEWIFWKYAAR